MNQKEVSKVNLFREVISSLKNNKNKGDYQENFNEF